MGDPRKQRKKYSGPQHPWNKARIDEEKILLETYGLKNKKELWKMGSKLDHFRNQAKALTARTGAQAEKEKQLFLEKLGKLKLLSDEATIADVLNLTVKDLLERRLQTILYRKALAKSVKQARQFIVHQHVYINGQKMDVPSYLVPVMNEDSIEFDPRSALADPEHPERKIKEKLPPAEEVKEEEPTAGEIPEMVEESPVVEASESKEESKEVTA